MQWQFRIYDNLSALATIQVRNTWFSALSSKQEYVYGFRMQYKCMQSYHCNYNGIWSQYFDRMQYLFCVKIIDFCDTVQNRLSFK